MTTEKLLSGFLSIGGIIMAIVFLIAIIIGLAGVRTTVVFAQIGILMAIIIPVGGLIMLLYMLFRKREVQFGICAAILLVILIATVIWRLHA